jgi:hypothetical protein
MAVSVCDGFQEQLERIGERKERKRRYTGSVKQPDLVCVVLARKRQRHRHGDQTLLSIVRRKTDETASTDAMRNEAFHLKNIARRHHTSRPCAGSDEP